MFGAKTDSLIYSVKPSKTRQNIAFFDMLVDNFN